MKKNIHNQYIIKQNKEDKTLIVPIFTPFWACPKICVFCNQTLQTGNCDEKNSISNKEKLQNLLDEASNTIVEYKNLYPIKEIEIAFYGGTFSALPYEEFALALSYIKDMKEKGYIQKARCSTRPDACQDDRLIAMKESGIDTIELGIQSFSNKALLASNRGYKEDIALEACSKVKEYNFNLGIQLMPNMPAQEIEDFYNDIDKVIAIKPNFIRLYPCLVVENTVLAKIWQEGKHAVWDKEATIDALAFAMFKMCLSNIDVIRVGVAPEKEFYKKVLAGIWQDNLGQIVQTRAIKELIKHIYQVHNLKDKELIWHMPIQAKGFIMLKKDSFWNAYNISTKNIKWHEREILYYEEK